MEFPVALENSRCDETCKDSPGSSSRGNHQIEGCEIVRSWFQGNQFTMTDYAASEQSKRVDQDLDQDLGIDAFVQNTGSQADGQEEDRQEYTTGIPPIAFEAQDK